MNGAEQAALDAWERGSADTMGMLYAVRAALAHQDKTEDARLALAEKQLADAAETIAGILENGPWALIPDPQLRQFVAEYVAVACHSIAAAAGLDTAMEQAHDATPVRLATALPGQQLAEDTRAGCRPRPADWQ
ncbi:hypothetical protein ABZ671_01070 [Micromonospora sp. NPDC006766]|uniref:hypothetical protein n=1 Tax=Micromonospora sp. NPDC006766 TaxID=3154778 RepID=UPI00340E24D7